MCPNGQRGRGLTQFGHFSDKEEGESIFCDFVRTCFMDGPVGVFLQKLAEDLMAAKSLFDYF